MWSKIVPKYTTAAIVFFGGESFLVSYFNLIEGES